MRRAALVAVLLLTACNPFFFLPPLKEGKHYVQPTTQTDIDRGRSVAACLQEWARGHGYPSADYTDVDFSKLVIVGVGDPGVVGIYNGATFEAAGRENGDSIFVSLRTIRHAQGQYVAISRHEDVHIVQERHPELQQGGNHWPPPFDYCRIPLAIFG